MAQNTGQTPIQTAEYHAVFPERRIQPPFPAGMQQAVFGLGCFWGAERMFWQTSGVYSTAVGYAGGQLAHPTYEQVCTGGTGHAEVVLVVFDPSQVSYRELLTVFGRATIPPKVCARATTLAPNTAQRSTTLTRSNGS